MTAITSQTISCPICQGPLTSDYSAGDAKIQKSCVRKLSHKFLFRYSEYVDMGISSYHFSYLNNIVIHWYLQPKNIYVSKGSHIFTRLPKVINNSNVIKIPWFEPDFYDYKKLINKLETYIIFS